MAALLNRRDVLMILAASAVSAPTLAATRWRNRSFQISLAQWSLHRAHFGGSMTTLDFARVARTEFDIGAIEFVNSFFKDKARDAEYLASLNQKAKDHDVKHLLIMIDGEGALGDADATRRTESIDKHKPWIDAAHTLGCHSIRVNAQSSGSYDEQIALAADGLTRLTEYAGSAGLNVIVENHGGLSSNGAWLAAVMKKVNMDRCGTLPDFGNFNISASEQYDRYTGVRELMPFAKAVSAKSHDFDEKGNEKHTDYRKMMRIVLDAGYTGYVGIEYEGSSLDEYAGIRATKRLLERVREEFQAEG